VNPADDAEKVTVRRSDEFNVLSIEDVHAVARAADDDGLIGAMIVVAAFTGLRQGELLAVRWRHVDFTNRILHVRRNLPAGTSEKDTPKSDRVRSVPLSDQAIVALVALSRREHFTGDDNLGVERDREALAARVADLQARRPDAHRRRRRIGDGGRARRVQARARGIARMALSGAPRPHRTIGGGLQGDAPCRGDP
jgi:integrase